jgi:hypothetical protein
MGVETPIPPKTINAAAPDGAPPRRIKTVGIIVSRFSRIWCETDRFMIVSPEHIPINTLFASRIKKTVESWY